MEKLETEQMLKVCLDWRDKYQDDLNELSIQFRNVTELRKQEKVVYKNIEIKLKEENTKMREELTKEVETNHATSKKLNQLLQENIKLK